MNTLKSPAIRANITLEATSGGPILAELIAAVLSDKGATVKINGRKPPKVTCKSLGGLKVDIVRVVHIIDKKERREREVFDRKITAYAKLNVPK
jgi:hypothetical protein